MNSKVAIITGASSGIGEATAKLLAARGVTVAPAARRLDQLKRIADVIKAAGGQVSVHQVDVIQQGQVEQLVADVVKQRGRLDVMINNAGLMAIAPLSLRKTEEWDRMIDINIKGPSLRRRSGTTRLPEPAIRPLCEYRFGCWH